MAYAPDNDGFSIHDVKCPSCNGPLSLPGNANAVVCPFCGSTVHVSYGATNQNDGPSGVEPDGTIRDRGTGYGLFRARVGAGWHVSATALQGTGSSSRPHIPQVELRDHAGSIVSLSAGEAGTRRSAGFSALMGMYGGHLSGIDRANYADVPDPQALADAAASRVAMSVGASGLKFTRQLACPDLESKKQRALARFQRLAQAQGASVANPFIGVVLRVYDCSHDGKPCKIAVCVALSATKDGMGIGEGFTGVAEGLGGLVEGIGSLFGGGNQPTRQSGQPVQTADSFGGAMDFFMGGGLMGKMKRDRAASQMQTTTMTQGAPSTSPNQQQIQSGVLAGQPGWCSPDFATYVSGGTIYWSVDAIATFVASADAFESQFESMFLPLVDSLEMHPDVENLALQVAMQEAGQIGQATQTQLAQNQAAFNAQQAAHRQQQAAFDAYNQSISDARNAHHQQFMASSQAQAGHSAPDYSEAIRGVNTYTTSDGREVELSVHADRAYENQAGDVIGATGGFDPGANWSEIPRT